MKVFSTLIGLGRTIALSSAVVCTSIVSSSEAAYAWFQVCNRSTESVSISFAYLEINGRHPDIFGDAPPELSRGWNSEGWWSLEPGKCAQTYPHELRARNRIYYVYAKGNRGGEWGGSNAFCTISREFILGNADKVCGNGGEWKRFKEVKTRDARNFTYNLQN